MICCFGTNKRLPRGNFTSTKCNVNHCTNDRGCILFVARVVSEPFKNDKKIHVSEKDSKKQYLGQKLMHKVQVILPVDQVNSFHPYA